MFVLYDNTRALAKWFAEAKWFTTIFNIFLERIMSDALEEHDGKISIGGGNITSLRFADDINALAEEEQELEALVESLNKTSTRCKMAISAEKTKLMTNSVNGIKREG